MLIRLQIAAVTAADLNGVLEGLVKANMARIRKLGLSPLYKAGVRYRREKPDTWSLADEVARRGYGDCEDLATYRAAELRLGGEGARAVVYRATPRMWHVVVMRGDGTIEDPSKKLGMRRRA